MGARAEPASASSSTAIRLGQTRLDRQAIVPPQIGVAGRALDRLGDPVAAEGAAASARSPAARRRGPLELLEPFLAEPEDQPAVRGRRRVGEQRPCMAPDQFGDLGGRRGARSRAVNASSAWSRTTTSGLSGARGTVRAAAGSGRWRPGSVSPPSRRAEQAQGRVASEVDDLVRPLQSGQSARRRAPTTCPRRSGPE